MYKTVPYKVAREQMETGDAILWKGTGLLSRAIRLFSEFSHVSLVVKFNHEGLKNRRFLFEAVGSGLVPRLLSERVADHKGEVYWLPTKMEDWQRKIIKVYALESAAKGIKYDFKSLFLNAFGYVDADAKRMLCSEWCYFSWLKAKYVLPLKKTPRPGDIPHIPRTTNHVDTPRLICPPNPTPSSKIHKNNPILCFFA